MPTKPNLPIQTKSNLAYQAYWTKPTKPKLVVKAVNTWVRSAFGNVSLIETLQNDDLTLYISHTGLSYGGWRSRPGPSRQRRCCPHTHQQILPGDFYPSRLLPLFIGWLLKVLLFKDPDAEDASNIMRVISVKVNFFMIFVKWFWKFTRFRIIVMTQGWSSNWCFTTTK